MTDDKVLRLIHEVTAYRSSHLPPRDVDGDEDKMGTLLEVGNDPARLELHRPQFYIDELVGDSLSVRARNLEIFLDAVAMYASSDNSWLLDRTFEFLLDAPARDLAREVRAVAQKVKDAGTEGDAWSALSRGLSQFGG